MAAQKGHKKAGGRQKGTRNKKTAEQLKRIEYVLGLLDETLEKDIKQLEPRERIKTWETLQEYIRPKLARTESEVNVTVKKLGKDLSDEIYE